MAISGMALFLFVVAHLLGNLQVFLGAEKFNEYGHFLQSKPELVWTARIGLLVMVLIHIWMAIKLTGENRAARPKGYGEYKPAGSSFASRTMFVSGLLLLAFIVFHLLHFTVRTEGVNMTGQDFKTFEDTAKRADIYRMVVVGFKQPAVAIFYIISMSVLCLHLSHGVSSMFQSLGWKNRKYGKFIDRMALVAGAALVVGYSSIPLAVLAGILEVPK